jgi:hypothetical protein
MIDRADLDIPPCLSNQRQLVAPLVARHQCICRRQTRIRDYTTGDLRQRQPTTVGLTLNCVGYDSAADQFVPDPVARARPKRCR